MLSRCGNLPCFPLSAQRTETPFFSDLHTGMFPYSPFSKGMITLLLLRLTVTSAPALTLTRWLGSGRVALGRIGLITGNQNGTANQKNNQSQKYTA